MPLKIYNSDADLMAEPKSVLVEIIKQLHCTLEIPEIKVLLGAQSIKNQMKQCQCCRPFCCLKVNI